MPSCVCRWKAQTPGALQSPQLAGWIRPPCLGRQPSPSGDSLMQGATGERLCWKPLAQRLQVRPVTPSLHGHCPVVWLQVLPAAPTGWQSQAGWEKEERLRLHGRQRVAQAQGSIVVPLGSHRAALGPSSLPASAVQGGQGNRGCMGEPWAGRWWEEGKVSPAWPPAPMGQRCRAELWGEPTGVRPSELLPHGAEPAWRFCTALGLVLVLGWSEVGLLNASQAHEPQHLSCLLEETFLFAGGHCPYDFPPQPPQGTSHT